MKYKNLSIILLLLLLAVLGLSFCNCIKEIWIPNKTLLMPNNVNKIIYFDMQNYALFMLTIFQLVFVLVKNKIMCVLSLVISIARPFIIFGELFISGISEMYGGLGHYETSFTLWGKSVIVISILIIILSIMLLIFLKKEES